MRKNDSDYSESDISSAEDEEAEARIRKMMEEIFKQGNKLSTKEDIDKMADHCTNMLTKMKTKPDKPKMNTNKSELHRGPLSGAGDSAKSKDTPKGSTKHSQDEFMATLMGGTSLRDIAKTKKERPKFGDIYKEKLAEKMKAQQKSSKSGLQKTAGDWRKAQDESDSSLSLESTATSSDTTLDEKELLGSMRTQTQLKSGSKLKSAGDRNPKTQANDFEAAKKKAEEWLRNQSTGLSKDGKSRIQLEELSSESDRELKNNLTRGKKNEEILKAKISALNKPKAPPILKKPTPAQSASSKVPSSGVKKPTATTLKPSTLTTKRPVKK